MTAGPDRWDTIQRLFHAALARPMAERAAFLAEACGDDEVVRREVESLLAQGASADNAWTRGAVVAAAGLVSDAGASALTGRRIGVYEVLAPIGAGGMGEVYRARDARLGRDVAVKILPRAFIADPDRLARFEREARVLASFNHPHIGAIHGVEECDGRQALVLEYVEGETLAERIARAGSDGLPINEALDIARQMAHALDGAHEKGIVHRDLKPANIKITPQGVVKVLDFGLAKLGAGQAGGAGGDLTDAPTITIGDTREGLIVGTAAYMSPEQARGQAVDKRTDIWAFGCVLYEMLTGRAAFGRATVSDTIAAVLEHEPDWTLLPVTTSPSIRQLVTRCLAKDPKRRTRDIGDVYVEIDDARLRYDDTPSTAAVSPRDWRGVALVVVSALLVLAATLSWVLFSGRATPSSPAAGSTARTTAAQLTDYGGTERAPALSPDGRSFVFVSDHGGTPDIWLRQISGGEPVRLTSDATEEADLAYAPDGEGIYFTRRDATGESIWQIGVLGGEARKLIADGHSAMPSPEGTRIAYMYRQTPNLETLAVFELTGGGKRVLAQGIPNFPRVRAAWSHDGRSLSFVRAGLFATANLFIVDVMTGAERQITKFAKGSIGGVGGVGQQAWLPDNRHLVLSYTPNTRAQGAQDLAILDVQNGSIARVTTTITDGFASPSLSADGSRLIATALRNDRQVWKVSLDRSPATSGSVVQLVPGMPDPLWTFVSRDGRTLLFNSPASGSRNLWTTALDGATRPRQITALPGDAVSHSSLSPDGSRVAFVSLATGNSDVWIQNVDGSGLRQLTNDDAADAWPVWSPDGRSIVFTSLRVGGPETRLIPAEGGSSEKLIDGFFRGDWIRNPGGPGTWIATNDGADRIRLIDVEHRTLLWDVQIAGSGNAMPVFSPNGLSISVLFQAGPDHDAIRILSSADGAGGVVATLPFRAIFRANWIDGGNALIVNRSVTLSHIALFDHFWEREAP